jgi:hypothetical protein
VQAGDGEADTWDFSEVLKSVWEFSGSGSASYGSSAGSLSFTTSQASKAGGERLGCELDGVGEKGLGRLAGLVL